MVKAESIVSLSFVSSISISMSYDAIHCHEIIINYCDSPGVLPAESDEKSREKKKRTFHTLKRSIMSLVTEKDWMERQPIHDTYKFHFVMMMGTV